ncbi:hypothetical protein ACWG0P_12065 [Amedibacillus sp. YH-ame6]
MLRKKEAVEQFKRDLKSLNYYKLKRSEVSDKLLELDRSMHEAKSNRYNFELGKGKFNYIELMEKEDGLKRELFLYEQLIVHIGNRLECIESDNDRRLLLDIYVHKQSYAKMSMKMFMSERNLKYHVDTIIRKIV